MNKLLVREINKGCIKFNKRSLQRGWNGDVNHIFQKSRFFYETIVPNFYTIHFLL